MTDSNKNQKTKEDKTYDSRRIYVYRGIGFHCGHIN